MDNGTMRVVGNKLVIELDLEGDLGLSKSGKTIKVSGTNGMERVPGSAGIMFNAAVYRKVENGNGSK